MEILALLFIRLPAGRGADSAFPAHEAVGRFKHFDHTWPWSEKDTMPFPPGCPGRLDG